MDKRTELGIPEPLVEPCLRFRWVLQRGGHELIKVLVPLPGVEGADTEECKQQGGDNRFHKRLHGLIWNEQHGYAAFSAAFSAAYSLSP